MYHPPAGTVEGSSSDQVRNTPPPSTAASEHPNTSSKKGRRSTRQQISGGSRQKALAKRMSKTVGAGNPEQQQRRLGGGTSERPSISASQQRKSTFMRKMQKDSTVNNPSMQANRSSISYSRGSVNENIAPPKPSTAATSDGMPQQKRNGQRKESKRSQYQQGRQRNSQQQLRHQSIAAGSNPSVPALNDSASAVNNTTQLTQQPATNFQPHRPSYPSNTVGSAGSGNFRSTTIMSNTNSIFHSAIDPQSNRTYYVHAASGQSSWTLPPWGTVMSREQYVLQLHAVRTAQQQRQSVTGQRWQQAAGLFQNNQDG
eukprot:g400.t1